MLLIFHFINFSSGEKLSSVSDYKGQSADVHKYEFCFYMSPS